jgi:hypothetical protein
MPQEIDFKLIREDLAFLKRAIIEIQDVMRNSDFAVQNITRFKSN